MRQQRHHGHHQRRGPGGTQKCRQRRGGPTSRHRLTQRRRKATRGSRCSSRHASEYGAPARGLARGVASVTHRQQPRLRWEVPRAGSFVSRDAAPPSLQGPSPKRRRERVSPMEFSPIKFGQPWRVAPQGRTGKAIHSPRLTRRYETALPTASLRLHLPAVTGKLSKTLERNLAPNLQ